MSWSHPSLVPFFFYSIFRLSPRGPGKVWPLLWASYRLSPLQSYTAWRTACSSQLPQIVHYRYSDIYHISQVPLDSSPTGPANPAVTPRPCKQRCTPTLHLENSVEQNSPSVFFCSCTVINVHASHKITILWWRISDGPQQRRDTLQSHPSALRQFVLKAATAVISQLLNPTSHFNPFLTEHEANYGLLTNLVAYWRSW